MKELIIREILVSLALGGMPIFVRFSARGESEMLNRLATLNPGDDIILCFVVLFLLHGTVFLVNKWWFKPNDRIDSIVDFVHGVTEQIGFGMHSIYRVITGAVPMALALLVYNHGATGAAQATALSVILVIGSLFISCTMSRLNESTKRQKRFL